ncbi:MAG: VanZ family protein [Saprospiraceae bacterium]
MKRIKLIKFIPGIAWFFVVLILLCMPAQDIPTSNWFDKIYFDKWVHAGIFGLLALLFMLPVALSPMESSEKMQFFVRVAIATSLWGIATEFVQKFWIPGRSFDLFDWAADSLGAIIAFVICRKKYILSKEV